MEVNYFKKSIPTLLVMTLFSVLGIFVFYTLLTPEKRLPIYSPVDVNPRLVDPSLHHIKKNHSIADFELIDQNAKVITQETYKDKIYIADFFLYALRNYLPNNDHAYECLTSSFYRRSRGAVVITLCNTNYGQCICVERLRRSIKG